MNNIEIKYIDILLATYNGAKYLNDQLESIEKQTYPYWKIIVRDDCSNDNTPNLLLKWKERLGHRMLIINDNNKSKLGALGNFKYLIQHSTANYISFCDQDDYWINTKLEVFINEMIELEDKYGSTKPCLVFSDLYVVNFELKIIKNSMWKFQKIDPNIVYSYKKLALSNCVTGCAMMINRAALIISLPMKNAVMHDWWIALNVSKNNGAISIVKEKLVKYRQHENNAIGAKRTNIISLIKKVMINNINKNELERCYKQANCLGIYKSKVEFILNKLSFSLHKIIF